jgi:HlyD family secretion protein
MKWAHIIALVAALAVSACSKTENRKLQGYIEGEYVYVASPRAGALEKLSVQRGAEVKTGAHLFTLENGAEKAAEEEAERRLAQARATLEDIKKGRRPEEIASIEAQLQQARSALALAEIELKRQDELFKTRANSTRDLDLARTKHEQDRQHVTQIEAELAIARLGSRADQIAAAEATVQAQGAALARAKWDLSQKQQSAPQAGQVFDTLYREGEWVAAGRPVVVLLPPQNIKLRTFVPEPRLGAVKMGAAVRVYVDGASQPVTGKVSFISPQAEFTPPVIYSQDTRAKLVFLIEAVFEPEVAAKLHPGQPVDVEF